MATQRAFVMIAVMLIAVVFHRRALSLRSVAFAACVILVMRPDALRGQGFQMSFAATTALVVVFQWWSRQSERPKLSIVKWAISVVRSSFIEGISATAFAAMHFNQILHFGLLANLLSVPLMGVLVTPSAVVSFVLMLFGLGSVGFLGAHIGLQWIVLVAGSFSGFAGATSGVITPQTWVMGVFVLSALFVILWQGDRKWLGLSGVIIFFAWLDQ